MNTFIKIVKGVVKKTHWYKSLIKRYDDYNEKRVRSIQDEGYKAVDIVTNISRQLQIPIWIDGGTLLGYVREGKLLSHDYDLDFGVEVIEEEKRERLLTKMIDAGCRHVMVTRDSKTIYHDGFDYKGAIIDINYYFPDGDGISYYEHNSNKHSKISQTRIDGKPVKRINGFELYRYRSTQREYISGSFKNGQQCIVPCDAEKRVVEMYGENYNEPIVGKDYLWTRDTETEYIGFYPEVYCLIKYSEMVIKRPDCR